MLTAPSSQLREASDDTRRSVNREVARVVALSSLRTGALWGLVFGVYVATQALAYSTTYTTTASRQLLVTLFAHDAAISALVGPANQINTVAGFTQWKCLAVLTIMGAVWGILTSTKLTRGEEDVGRWEILLAGPITRRGGARQAVEGLALGWLGFFVVTAILFMGLGATARVRVPAGHMLFFALTSCAGAFMFLAVGALCAQFASTRRQAASYASVVLGVCYALRMVADSGTGLTWLRWVSPLGWVEELQPLTKATPIALVPIGAFTVVALVVTVSVAGRRDLGAGVLSDRSITRRTRSLPSGPASLGLYLVRPTFMAWCASIVAYGLLLGSIAKSGGKMVTSSSSIRLVLSRLGVSGADAYLGVALLIMAIALCFVAVGQVASARREESTGQLENLLVRPMARLRWFFERVGLAAVIVVVLAVLAGLSTWVGAASDHADVHFASMIDAGLNVAVPALVLLGIGALAFALRPRLATAITYGVFVWFVSVEILGTVAQFNHWVLDSSVLHQIAPAPSMPVDWSTNGVMLLLALASGLAAAYVFNGRDVVGE